jgi:hypothetical protein
MRRKPQAFGHAGISGGMTVRELIAVLSACNPESTVICEARSEALLVIGARPGMHEEWLATEPLNLTVADEDFLDALHIRHAR